MENPVIRIASVAHDSIVDGPGLRYVLFTQGCPHHCKGCHNPATHDPSGGMLMTGGEILSDIDRNPLLTGVTFSGGEPMLQVLALLPLAEAIRARRKSLWIYTGYLWEELLDVPEYRALLETADVVVDGPFIESRKNLLLPFRGSENQRIIDVAKSLGSGVPTEKNIIYSI